jgi:hypothetical protein
MLLAKTTVCFLSWLSTINVGPEPAPMVKAESLSCPASTIWTSPVMPPVGFETKARLAILLTGLVGWLDELPPPQLTKKTPATTNKKEAIPLTFTPWDNSYLGIC